MYTSRIPNRDTSPEYSAALRVFHAHTGLARRVEGGMQRRFLGLLRRETRQIAMGALWESARKYHHLPPEQFEAVASVRMRGAIIDDRRTSSMLPRRNSATKWLAGEAGKLSIVRIEAHDLSGQDALLSAHATTRDPESEIDAARLRARLAQAVDALPDERERYIVRATLAGRRHKDIAVDLGVSEPRVSQILVRATARLKAALTSTRK